MFVIDPRRSESATARVVGRIARYVGREHRWARTRLVLVVAIHRPGESVLDSDVEVGGLGFGDQLEVAMLTADGSGTLAASPVTFCVRASALDLL